MAFLFAFQAFCQDSRSNEFNKDYYLQKTKTQNTVGWILLGAGTTAIVAGIISGTKKDDDLADVGVGVVAVVSGVVVDLVSIPFFISAAKNKKRAATAVAFHMQPMNLPIQQGFVLKQQPTISVKIGF